MWKSNPGPQVLPGAQYTTHARALAAGPETKSLMFVGEADFENDCNVVSIVPTILRTFLAIAHLLLKRERKHDDKQHQLNTKQAADQPALRGLTVSPTLDGSAFCVFKPHMPTKTEGTWNHLCRASSLLCSSRPRCRNRYTLHLVLVQLVTASPLFEYT
jgi:hypothetical protein